MDSGTVQIFELLRPAGIPYALVVLAITVLAARLATRALDRLGERFADKRLRIQQGASFLRFGIYLLGGLGAALLVLQFRPGVWLAVGGTAAVAVGFALKDIAASLVAGVIILVDKPLQVGDRVTVGDYYGEVTHIGLRSVRLKTLDDTMVTVPNSRFLTDVVASGNAGAVEMMIRMDFWIGVDQDLPRAKRVVEEALTSSLYVHLGRPWSVTVSQVIEGGYLAVRLRAKAYVLDVRFEKAFESDVTERVLEAFAEAGIKPPAVLHRGVGAPVGE
ncbi:MAG TPA: mechanosensitive ion channel domain-containing protein [Candidatus Saccharimonadales bacterium]|nr:mechanosensitive ion channel domain-containing protein [Candidatus Saccharimonadales bacterium]